jgi:alcohol dehydrogenase (cytochrome c)
MQREFLSNLYLQTGLRCMQSGWGVDAQRIQDALAKQNNVGVSDNVPQGGVVWVFAVKQ